MKNPLPLPVFPKAWAFSSVVVLLKIATSDWSSEVGQLVENLAHFNHE